MSEANRGAYLDFARTAFGISSYQASPSYLDWLYAASPLTRGLGDCRVAVVGDRIVGCIHVMRMPWLAETNLVIIPALHNTMVLPYFRTGAGGLLIAQALRGEPLAFVPGAEGAVADILRRLGFVEASLEWRIKWLRPVRAAGRLLWSRLVGKYPVTSRFDLKQSSIASQVHVTDTTNPSALEVQEVLVLADVARAGGSVFLQAWTEDIFRWRFFHPLGPRHRLFMFRRNGVLVGYAIGCCGLRRGIYLARVVDWSVESSADVRPLLNAVARAYTSNGAHLLMVGSGNSKISARLAESGWGWRRDCARALVYNRGGHNPRVVYGFMPSAGDYGLEAIAPVDIQ